VQKSAFRNQLISTQNRVFHIFAQNFKIFDHVEKCVFVYAEQVWTWSRSWKMTKKKVSPVFSQKVLGALSFYQRDIYIYLVNPGDHVHSCKGYNCTCLWPWSNFREFSIKKVAVFVFFSIFFIKNQKIDEKIFFRKIAKILTTYKKVYFFVLNTFERGRELEKCVFDLRKNDRFGAARIYQRGIYATS